MNEDLLSIWKDENPPAQILSYLYLGDMINAINSRELMELNIQYLLNASFPQTKDYFEGKHGFEPHFERCFDFINSARSKGSSIMVYCK